MLYASEGPPPIVGGVTRGAGIRIKQPGRITYIYFTPHVLPWFEDMTALSISSLSTFFMPVFEITASDFFQAGILR